MPKMYIVSGCNGSGKTTASYTMLPGMFECRDFVNSDEFAKSLNPFSPNSAAIGASRYMLMKIKYMMKKKKDFGIETTLATRSLKKLVEVAQAQGYYVTVLYFWLNSPELAIQRVQARVAAGGHNIDEETIRRRYAVGMHYFFADYINLADRWILADNTEIPFKVIAQGWKDNMVVKDNILFEKIKAQALGETKKDNSENSTDL